MQRLVWTETRVSGPRRFDAPIPQPPANLGFYRDIATLAFRTPAGDEAKPVAGTAPDSPAPYRQVEYAGPFTARAVLLTATPPASGPAVCDIEASGDGAHFRRLRRFDTGWRTGFAPFGSITVAIPETTGRWFRISGTDFSGQPATAFRFELMGSARVDLWELKSGLQSIREHGGGAHMFAPVRRGLRRGWKR